MSEIKVSAELENNKLKFTVESPSEFRTGKTVTLDYEDGMGTDTRGKEVYADVFSNLTGVTYLELPNHYDKITFQMKDSPDILHTEYLND
jgi:hypothetical protein